MKAVITYLERINLLAGRFFSWCTLLLVVLICLDVVLRYAFKFSFIWIIEMEIYFFAMIFLLSSGYAFQHDSHVRVDLFYSNFSERKKNWTNLIGGLFLLLPWSVVSTYVSFTYFFKSFKLGEASPQPGGLPALYILKFILFLGFLLLMIQALTNILDSAYKLRNNKVETVGLTEENSKE